MQEERDTNHVLVTTHQAKKYQAPAILYREYIEAMASTCTGGTAKSGFDTCPIGPISS